MHEPAANDLYAVLGVARDAPAHEIRRAYRRLARQHHPDLTEQPEGSETFVRLARAYEVLHDPAQRAHYDRSLPRSAATPQPPRMPRDLPPPVTPWMRRGILELSPAEALHMAHYPLALHDADGHTIVVPAGTRHGDKITILDGSCTAILIVRTHTRT